jgi:hypothetical protein
MSFGLCFSQHDAVFSLSDEAAEAIYFILSTQRKKRRINRKGVITTTQHEVAVAVFLV